MKYSLSLVVLFFFAVAQGFSATFDEDGFWPQVSTGDPEESEGIGESSSFPSSQQSRPFPQPSLSPSQSQPQPQSPLQRATAAGSVPNESPGETRVRLSMRSQMDPDNPFSGLLLDSRPVDPNSRITGKPLTLCEMLESVSSPQLRCQLLHAYWALAGEIAKYKIALIKQAQFSEWVRDPDSAGSQSSMLQAAQRRAIAQSETRELLVILKQTELAALLRQTGHYRPVVQATQAGTEQLPIPIDLPFIGVYETHVHQLVQYRPVSNLLLLDKTISLRKQIFESKFEESGATKELFDAIRGSRPSAESLIQMTNQHYEAYVEFIDAIIAYNEAIAEYVALSVGPEVTGRRLLMTLIQLNPETSEPTENPADSVPVLGF